MKRLAACLALLALTATATAQEPRAERGPGGGSGQRGGYANPSAAIAAEIAFAQLARDKGQWTAFKATAAEDAVMFAPAMILAQAWLKDRTNPPVPLTWQPYEVWSSCDGSLMVTTGAWQREGKHGWFTTVWQRQVKGGYKWVFDHGDETREPVAEPDMIAAHVATCPDRKPGQRPAGGPPPGKPEKQPKAPPVPFDPTKREGGSKDGTLTWRVTADAAGTHDFTAQMMVEGQMTQIRGEHVAAAGQ